MMHFCNANTARAQLGMMLLGQLCWLSQTVGTPSLCTHDILQEIWANAHERRESLWQFRFSSL